MKKPTESALLRVCLDWLTLRKVWHVRLNSGAFIVQDHGRKPRLVRAGIPGLADVLIVIRGLALFVETKSPTGRQRPSQEAFEAAVKAAGARYAIVRRLEDLVAVVEGMQHAA